MELILVFNKRVCGGNDWMNNCHMQRGNWYKYLCGVLEVKGVEQLKIDSQ
jgi:hypothetical protein